MAGERCSFPQEIGRNGGNLLPSSFYQHNHHHHHDNHYDGGSYDVDDGDGRNGGNLLPSLVLPTMMMVMDIVIMMMIS